MSRARKSSGERTHGCAVRRGAREAVAALVTLLGVAGCSAAAPGADSGSTSGPSGTLHYSGTVNGSAKIVAADCVTVNGKLVAFEAPPKDNAHPGAFPGPHLQIGISGRGAMVNFFVVPAHTTQSTVFMRPHYSSQGIAWAKTDGRWTVTLSGMKMTNYDFSTMRGGSVVLDGTLVCTRHKGS